MSLKSPDSGARNEMGGKEGPVLPEKTEKAKKKNVINLSTLNDHLHLEVFSAQY